MKIEYTKFTFIYEGDPSVGIPGDEIEVKLPNWLIEDKEEKKHIVAAFRKAASDLFGDSRIKVYELDPNKADNEDGGWSPYHG